LGVAARPYEAAIAGILNITQDSFSDGGLYLQTEAAVAHAHALRADGADLVELGAASSNPDAAPVSSAEEIQRLAPVLDEIQSAAIPVGVDTCAPATQSYCMARGVEVLNDIDGFAHPELYRELAAARCRLVVMHSIQGGGRATRVHADADAVVERLLGFFDERVASLRAAGVARERLILDPGMGLFLGVNPEPSLRVLARIQTLRERFDLPLMISVSRKSFLREITGRSLRERGAATLAAEIWAASQGVDYIRTHDVRALRDALAVLRAIRLETGPDAAARPKSSTPGR
jgi:dihydropteroate synthase type 2